jgi:UMF1 family MFS transporter
VVTSSRNGPEAPVEVAPRGQGGGRAAILGWVFFDWACQPFFTLVTTFIFAPYFAAVLAPDPVAGQSLWGYATAAAGLALAVLSPTLGAVADASGPKKPWIAAAGAVLVVASAALWFAEPGTPHGVPVALAAFGIGTIAAEIAAVFNNAMMPSLVPPDRVGRLSGWGWALGYAGGLVSLVLALGLLIADGDTGRTSFGIPSVFGEGGHEGERFMGPFSALWFLAFVWPLMLFTPDLPRRRTGVRAVLGVGLANVRNTLRDARRHPGVLRFLAANMVYQDALVALFAFGGIYGAGVFGWGPVELGLFGILLTITGTIGALVGGALDDRLGAKPVILGSIAILALVCVAVLSLGREHVLFLVETAAPSPTDGLYGTAPEKLFLALGLVIGAVAGPLQASSRSLLARLVPPEEAGRYFGLLALSGKLTSFLAPLAVAVATSVFQTQAAGSAVLIVFLVTGGALLQGVRRV